MRINPETLLFEDLTDAEADELHRVAESMLFDHAVIMPPWAHEWFKATKAEITQITLWFSTVFPARVFLSVLKHREQQRQEDHALLDQLAGDLSSQLGWPLRIWSRAVVAYPAAAGRAMDRVHAARGEETTRK